MEERASIGKGDDGYNDIVEPAGFFSDYSTHPNLLVQVNSKIKSTAAGRYQLLAPLLRTVPQTVGPFGFLQSARTRSPSRTGAPGLWINQGRENRTGNQSLFTIWLSLPGAGYGQREHKLADLIRKCI